MRHLIEAAQEYGLNGIVEQAQERKEVHGIIVDVDPFWLYCWYLYRSDPTNRFLDAEMEYYYRVSRFFSGSFGRVNNFQNFQTPQMVAGKIDLTWRPNAWKDFEPKTSNLVVKILLRPNSSPIEIKYEGQLRIIQEVRPVPRLSQNSQSMVRPLEGGLSIGHGKDSPGTLGGILIDPKTSKRYALTCGHVINAVVKAVDQPSQADNSAYGSCKWNKHKIRGQRLT